MEYIIWEKIEEKAYDAGENYPFYCIDTMNFSLF